HREITPCGDLVRAAIADERVEVAAVSVCGVRRQPALMDEVAVDEAVDRSPEIGGHQPWRLVSARPTSTPMRARYTVPIVGLNWSGRRLPTPRMPCSARSPSGTSAADAMSPARSPNRNSSWADFSLPRTGRPASKKPAKCSVIAGSLRSRVRAGAGTDA